MDAMMGKKPESESQKVNGHNVSEYAGQKDE